ncbi:deoxynucleoside kinase [Candidatus Woesearchaeota archaeon]|nr:deoxynucleoside kinase [Candidatus Woesearchaeota archaeon]
MESNSQKGFFVIIDGLDGSGKSTILNAIADYLKKKGKKVFELKEYWKTSHSLPEPEELIDYDAIISAEPTFSMIGKAIREEIIKDNKRDYSALTTATAYSLDRLILYKRLIIPLLGRGKIIVQDRSVTTSIVYQPIQAEPLSLKKLLALEGNALALKHRSDLLIIADVKAEDCIKRLGARDEKKDNVIFENLEFQQKAYKRFKSKWFRKLFEGQGSKVVYLDANKTKEEVANDAIKVFEDFLK